MKICWRVSLPSLDRSFYLSEGRRLKKLKGSTMGCLKGLRKGGCVLIEMVRGRESRRVGGRKKMTELTRRYSGRNEETLQIPFGGRRRAENDGFWE